MVAYSFKSQFATPIEERRKRQTIRADRKRHARPGESLQLFVGMRTKHCRKIIPDPVCTAVQTCLIMLDKWAILGIQIDGVELFGSQVKAFARDDGFEDVDAMHKFWIDNHGCRNFNGVIIRWADQPKEKDHAESTLLREAQG